MKDVVNLEKWEFYYQMGVWAWTAMQTPVLWPAGCFRGIHSSMSESESSVSFSSHLFQENCKLSWLVNSIYVETLRLKLKHNKQIYLKSTNHQSSSECQTMSNPRFPLPPCTNSEPDQSCIYYTTISLYKYIQLYSPSIAYDRMSFMWSECYQLTTCIFAKLLGHILRNQMLSIFLLGFWPCNPRWLPN